jgi:hypothetical protein
VTVRISDRSITTPPSHVLRPATLWPPPRTASGSPESRVRFTAAAMSSVVWQRAISAGRASTVPFQRALAWS